MEKLKVFSIPVNIGTYQEFISTILENAVKRMHYYTCVANVHMLVEAYSNHEFANNVQDAHIITPDGQPLTWAIRMLYGIKQERVAGMDLLPDLLEQAQARQLPVYFYGGDDRLIKKTRNYLALHYADLKIAGMYNPPFRQLSDAEEDEAVNRINDSGAQIVFVALGCPKQEKWMAATSKRINAIMIGIGGALSVMIGEQKRAPKWIQSAGLEWLFRFSQEPARLFKRYAVTNSVFIYLFLRSFLRVRVFNPAQDHRL